MKSTKKIISALVLLLISAVVLSSASYAWFTISRTVSAYGMDVTVTVPNNLLIDRILASGETEADDASWMDKEKINTTNVTLFPASSVNAFDFFSIERGCNSATGELTPDAIVNSVKKLAVGGDAPAEGNYYDFEYRVKTEGDSAVDVALSSVKVEGSYAKVDAVAGTSNGSFTLTTGRVITFGDQAGADYPTEAAALNVITNAIKPVRVAIFASSTAKPQDTATVGGVSPTLVGIYNLNNGENQTSGKAFNAAKAEGDTYASKLGDVTYQTGGDAETKIFTVATGDAFEYVTIRVWYEGEDTNCICSASYQAAFNVTAEFSAVVAP